ncbi:MAG TPA: GNAT family protein [Mycobacteriales bacterium]|nr:GNAT family protein [Mycobacteriales bacterium]
MSGGPRWPGGVVLSGRVVRLTPSLDDDVDGLFRALDYDEVWAAGYSGGSAARPDGPQGWRDRMAAARRDGRAMFTVRLLDGGEIVGTTSLGDADITHERVHLGWTAYRPDVWGTTVNPECKLLLMTHAFEDCGFGRVKIQTDLINQRSQAAIAKLGATREGVLRRHMKRGDGTWRDTVVFSVTVEEWPQVKAGLQARVVKG